MEQKSFLQKSRDGKWNKRASNKNLMTEMEQKSF